ncbi:MAG: transcriptional regulator [Desulfovibrio sp.]|nr:transcriptional regulator [Desulfovibrio sp.]
MNRTERLYHIDRMLSERRIVSLQDFLEELGVSRATFKRDLEYLRDRLHAPIVWDREAQGYRFTKQSVDGPAYELPGLWFTAGEVYALLAAHKVLTEIEPGILAARIAPLQARLTALLETPGHPSSQVTDRVRLLSMGRRRVEPKHFSHIAKALLERQRLRITAYIRGRDEETRRIVSPQRLIHYRDNWYLDVWCHLRESLRTFSMENIREVRTESASALDVPEADLQAHFASAYGIFSGRPTAMAVLLFSPERTRWVEAEVWHPKQRGERRPDGSYRLEIPYGDPRELVMDILRHGASVEVERPEELRSMVALEAAKITEKYRR